MIWGLLGKEPETIAPDDQEPLYQGVVSSAELLLEGRSRYQRHRVLAASPTHDAMIPVTAWSAFTPQNY